MTVYKIDEEIKDPKSVIKLLVCSDSTISRSRFYAMAGMNNLEEVAVCTSDTNVLHYLFDALNHTSSLCTLEIAILGISQIPNGLYSMSSLRRVDLSENNLYLLSDSLRYLNHLTSLNLAFNRFNEVPEALEQLESLEELSLMFNQIVTDSIFCKLSRLQKLKTLLIGGTITESGFSCFSI